MKKWFIYLCLSAFLVVSCETSDNPDDPENQQEVALEAVDLGLSVKWANLNVGAKSPEAAGDYFAWGEKESKWEYGWYCYQLGHEEYAMEKYNSLPMYGEVDGKSVLEAEDDVATKVNGEGWRMPTSDEWKELCTGCTWTWTKQNEVAGYLVSGKKPGFEDKSIFLPAGGGYDNDGLDQFGEYGFYWTASLRTQLPNCAIAGSFTENKKGLSVVQRFDGLSVRPVYGEAVAKTQIETVTLDQTEVFLNVGESVLLTASLSPSDAADKTVIWNIRVETPGVEVIDFGEIRDDYSADKSYAQFIAKTPGRATVTATACDGGAFATCSFVVKAAPPEAIDLGLSVKWGSFNVGAENPEESGDYFAWGEAQPNGEGYPYAWFCYEMSGRGEGSLYKYNSWSSAGVVDGRVILDAEDDAATERYGGQWRTPTMAEMYELLEKCTWTWTTQEGVNGYLVTSDIPGYTDRAIFLPASGYRWYDHHNDVGTAGWYWTATLYTPQPFTAGYMDFNADSYDISTLWRCGGLTVRPVCGPVVPQTANLVLDKTTLALAPGETSVLICTASGAAGASVGPMWSSSNSAVATVDDKGNVTAVFTGTSTISAVTVDGAAKAVCEVTVGPVTPEYIDLGLSVKWATFNLGATAPEEPGVFFAWGETVAKNTFDWTNYKWCKGRENTLTKYNADSAQGTVDNKTVLEPEDDAATAAYGPGWRIPTAEEWQELFDNGTLVYYDDNVGFRLRSNKEGFTDKTIFIPYGGSMSGFTLYGSSGRYWTASRDGNSVVGLYPVSRIFNEKPYFGQAIRPVHE